MTIKSVNEIPISKKTQNLFAVASILVDADLEIPRIEATARKTLSELQERGYIFQQTESGCLFCLHLALIRATAFHRRSKQVPSSKKRRSEMPAETLEMIYM